MTVERVDVVVIGAGLAGLRTAELVMDAGRSVVVLEARDRVGGRTRTEDWHGARLDLGGQWIGPTQHRLAALARRLGVETFPTPVKGDRIVDLDGAVTREKTEGRWPSLAQLAESLGKRYVDGLAAKVPPEDARRAPDAEALDRAPLSQWRDRVLPLASLQKLFDVGVKTVFGAESHALSVLYFLWYLQTGGGFGAHVDVKGGAQEKRFVQGAQALSEGVAARLGARVRLGAAAREVVQFDDGVRVTAGGVTYEASRVVCAVPPSLVETIAFVPRLPATRRRMLSRMPMGATVKVVAAYERAFWQEKGLSGEAVSGDGLVSYCVDNTSHDGRVAMLLGFVVGDAAVAWTSLDPEVRKGRVLDQFARWFGDEAKAPKAFTACDWAEDEWTGGCPVCNPAPGTLSAPGETLRDPVGRVHWAGTETAVAWTGYLEGALESAERAAHEVMAG